MTNVLIQLAFRTFLSYVLGTVKNPCSDRANKIVEYGDILQEAYEELHQKRREAGCESNAVNFIK